MNMYYSENLIVVKINLTKYSKSNQKYNRKTNRYFSFFLQLLYLGLYFEILIFHYNNI